MVMGLDPNPRAREPRRQQCDTGCGTEIVDMYGALYIEIRGGYGMFFDNLGQAEPAALTICHDCTVELFEFSRKFPKAIAKAMDRADALELAGEGGGWHPDEIADDIEECPWCYNWQEMADRMEAEKKSLDS